MDTCYEPPVTLFGELSYYPLKVGPQMFRARKELIEDLIQPAFKDLKYLLKIINIISDRTQMI